MTYLWVVAENTQIPGGDFFIYDGECPICRQYVAWTALRRSHPDIQLIDARANPQLVIALRDEGIEINDTNLLQLDGKRYAGAAAMARVSQAMVPQTAGEHVVRFLTRPERLLRPLYPWIARARKALLWLTGRDQIR